MPATVAIDCKQEQSDVPEVSERKHKGEFGLKDNQEDQQKLLSEDLNKLILGPLQPESQETAVQNDVPETKIGEDVGAFHCEPIDIESNRVITSTTSNVEGEKLNDAKHLQCFEEIHAILKSEDILARNHENLAFSSLSSQTLIKEPTAPTETACFDFGQIRIELPIDREVEVIKFPLSFESCVSQIIEDQSRLSLLKPFTADQMRGFYENSLLEEESMIVESFLDSQKNLEVHPLFEHLNYYLRYRLELKSTMEELGRLNQEIDGLASQLWIVENKKATAFGDCADGKRVRAQDEYPVADFNKKASAHLVRQQKNLRKIVQEKLALNVYESHLWKLRIDSLLSRGEQPLHGSVSILFAFLRRPVKDPIFIDHLKQWLNYVTLSLLKCARKEEYLFLAHHILR